MKKASSELEAFLDKAFAVSCKHGLEPKVFPKMRRTLGSLEATRKIVEAGTLQDFLKKMQQADILKWSLEAAVIKFKKEFEPATVQCAKWRLKLVEKEP